MARYFQLIVLVPIAASFGLCRADPLLEDSFERIYPIGTAATLRIRNIDGSIRIYGADTDQVKVQAVKKAYSAQRLKQIAINVTADAHQLSIETKYPPRPKWGLSDRSGTVDYIIILPQTCSISDLQLETGEVLVEGLRGADVHASLQNGRMFGHNCFSDLHLNVANGGLDVGYDWWEDQRFAIDGQIGNGNIRAFIPGEASLHLWAATLNGHVATDFGDKRDRPTGGLKKIDTKIGADPHLNVHLRATNGSVQVWEVNF